MSSKKIILCPNTGRDAGFGMTRKAVEIFKKHGRETVVCPVFEEDFGSVPEEFPSSVLERELDNAEVIITFGGDGTILRTARTAAGSDVPILGINMGGKGFLAELETEDIEMIGLLADGGYRLERRMMLDVELNRDGETVCRDFALNDVVVNGLNKIIELTLFGDGQRISCFSGDGAIVATPTGSTAYSLAAGGPIVEPAAYNIIITPICAHILEAKPVVLAPDRHVSIELGNKKVNPAYMSVDGCESVTIQSGDIINVCKSEKYTYFARLSDRSFYTMVNEKLGGTI